MNTAMVLNWKSYFEMNIEFLSPVAQTLDLCTISSIASEF